MPDNSCKRAAVRMAVAEDAGAIAAIYNHYIETTVVTFEEKPVAAAEIAQRMKAIEDAALPWMVAEQDGAIAGYAYAGPWRARSAYRYSAEATVYLRRDATGQGIGTELYAVLLAELRRRGFHAIMGGITLPNPVSVALHEKFGFVKVAHFKEVGFKFDRWLDVGYWQLSWPLQTGAGRISIPSARR